MLQHQPGFGDPRGNFVAGEMIAHVSLDDSAFAGPEDPAQRRPFTEGDATDVVEALRNTLKASSDPQLNQLRIQPVASVHNQQAGKNFSPVFFGRLDQRGISKDAHVLVRIELPDHINWNDYPRNYDIVEKAVKALNRPNALEVPGLGDIELVMPSWIMTGGSHHGSSGSGGGPGAPPIAIDAAEFLELTPHADTFSWNTVQWPFHIRFIRSANDALEQEVTATERGEGVIVLVLDTAPEPDAIEQSPIDNPLLVSLRQALTKVREDLGDLPVSEVEPSGGGPAYMMTDHGLFVAGLIHDIAPAAEIQLWRVLNKWGGGDLNTLFHAMAEALDLARGTDRPVIINLSLVINTPEDVRRLQHSWGSQGFNFDQAFIKLLELVMGEHLKTRCVAVAAAGNGSGGPGAARLPRYPARLDTLISVAASKRRGGHAEFSDRGDDAGSGDNGVAIFGGNAAYPGGVPTIPAEVDPISEVRYCDAPIGLMISAKIPEGFSVSGPVGVQRPNQTGWAYWAGTSFAAPIVSGLAACLLSKDPSSTPNAIVNILAKAVETGPESELKVKGIPARQLKFP